MCYGLQSGEWRVLACAGCKRCYYILCMAFLGVGPALINVSPWLRDPEERARRILDVTERDSVIEGLPPLTKSMRARLEAYLVNLPVREQGPT